ncbi:MAG: TIGR04255 family protein [Betaproteobacteria bacterium]|nr:TIGR04255 family protein [Betaproteobacteria bacterium]
MYEQVCYQKSFLKQVIARIDLAAPIDKLDKGPPTPLLSAIIKDFSIVEPADLVVQQIAVNAASVQHSQTSTKQWNFFSKERDRQLVLAPQVMFVQYSKYNTYEEVKRQFAAAIEAMNTAFPGTVASRFGLRYINQIDHAVSNPLNWSEFINNHLISGLAFYTPDDTLTRVVSIAELKCGDLAVRFQYGMPNPDHPAPIKRPFFILDIDASISEAHELTKTIDYMDQAHSCIQRLFEKSITENLRRVMNARPIQQ